jgi:hypothetical protein
LVLEEPVSCVSRRAEAAASLALVAGGVPYELVPTVKSLCLRFMLLTNLQYEAWKHRLAVYAAVSTAGEGVG